MNTLLERDSRDYKPEKSKDTEGINPHVKANWYLFWITFFVTGLPVLFMVDWFPMIEKSNVMLRWMFSFYPKAWIVAVFVNFCLLFMDTLLNGNLFKGSIHSPLACGMVVSAVVFVAGLLAVFC